MFFRPKNAEVSRQEAMVQRPFAALPRTRETGADALLDHMVEDIPTVFGRLVYLAALCDPEKATYRHPVLCQLLPDRDADHILRAAHRRVFARWLEFNLRQQQGDLTRYLGYGALGPALLRQLRDRDAFRTLPPAEAAAHEKVLFVSDLALVMNSALVD